MRGARSAGYISLSDDTRRADVMRMWESTSQQEASRSARGVDTARSQVMPAWARLHRQTHTHTDTDTHVCAYLWE